MNTIFLDIDGVLNRLGTPEQGRTAVANDGFIGMDPELTARFNKLAEDTDSQIVLSSTWRLAPDWMETMKQYGLCVERFVGRTPRHDTRVRGHEIHEWLKDNPDAGPYAIIDDDSDMLITQRGSFFHTSYITGLTEEICDRIRNHLSGHAI